MKRKVGFPATLFYFSYAPFWRAFFEGIGDEVVFSPLTTKEILDEGIRVTITDACVPIKLYHGHILSLKERVDCLFIPRLVSVDKMATFCPKFLGLPDMIKATTEKLPEIIAPTIDLKNSLFSLWKVCRKLAHKAGCKLSITLRAYIAALKTHQKYNELLHRGLFPLEAMKLLWEGGQEYLPKKRPLNIAVLGYPYQIYDPYISVNMLKYLEELDVRVWTMDMIPRKKLTPYTNILEKNLFWYYSNLVIWSLYYYLKQPQTDGIIHVTAFACGPDAMVDKLMELEMKKYDHIPFMSLTIDEHSGEAGIRTRLEAFVDMIKFRRKQI